MGRRVYKETNYKRTNWLWNGNVPLHEWESLSTESILHLVTWVFEEGTFVPCAKITEDQSYSIITDYLGTPTQMFDEDGKNVWDAELDIYGKVPTFKGSSLNDCPFRYQGQYEDSETGLYYNRFRYYDPESGNYISQDPIGLAGDFNVYSYVLDTNYLVDCFGLMPWEPGTPKPKGWRLPKNGTWSGVPGHSNFIPNDPTSIGLKPGASIPFVKGTPDFSSIQVRDAISVPGMTGNQSIDKILTANALVEKYPNEFKNQKAALDWMKDNKITPHHFQGDTMQLVPTKPHDGIRHSGTAHEKRGKGGHH